MRCDGWMDHDWQTREWLESGRHPTRGRFHKFRVACSKCGKKTVETRWADQLRTLPFDAEPPTSGKED